MTLQTGQVLQNRYRIVSLLGQGGFGAVYKAWDLNLNHPCAVKENLDVSPEAQQQFQREAKILYTLRHPNLPAVIDYFLLPGRGQYLVMDYIEGLDLAQLLQQQGPLDTGQALNWVGQVCQALAYLHSQTPAIIHRDIKPANIKITPQGKAVLVDFGISKVYDSQLKTTMGARAVTPGYSPIEQYGQGQTDARTDVYALAATLYTLLTGQEPPEAPTLLSGAAALVPAGQYNRAVPGYLAAAIEKGMNSRPTDRYQTVNDFQQALNRPAPPPIQPAMAPPPARSPWLFMGIGLGAALLLFLVIGVLVWPTIVRGLQPTATSLVAVAPTATPTDTPTPTATLVAGAVGRFPMPNGAEVAMVYVPEGEFRMGSNNGSGDEQPEHTVYLDSYYIDQTEVTNAMYAACVAAGVCNPPAQNSSYSRESYYNNPTYANYPVIWVSWEDANAFCQWRDASLPTEAQWEKAARGTEGRIYPWGNSFVGTRLNFCDVNCTLDWRDANWDDGYEDTAPAGSYFEGASPYGALDMAGNVWEWVADWYDSSYYASSPAENPAGPADGTYKVLRGGSWSSSDDSVRAANRSSNDPTDRSGDVGLRCAQE